MMRSSSLALAILLGAALSTASPVRADDASSNPLGSILQTANGQKWVTQTIALMKKAYKEAKAQYDAQQGSSGGSSGGSGGSGGSQQDKLPEECPDDIQEAWKLFKKMKVAQEGQAPKGQIAFFSGQMAPGYQNGHLAIANGDAQQSYMSETPMGDFDSTYVIYGSPLGWVKCPKGPGGSSGSGQQSGQPASSGSSTPSSSTPSSSTPSSSTPSSSTGSSSPTGSSSNPASMLGQTLNSLLNGGQNGNNNGASTNSSGTGSGVDPSSYGSTPYGGSTTPVGGSTSNPTGTDSSSMLPGSSTNLPGSSSTGSTDPSSSGSSSSGSPLTGGDNGAAGGNGSNGAAGSNGTSGSNGTAGSNGPGGAPGTPGANGSKDPSKDYGSTGLGKSNEQGTPGADKDKSKDKDKDKKKVDDKLSEADVQLLARIVKGEMPESAPREEQVAVAAIVINRLKSGGFGQSLSDVIHEQGPNAFACMNLKLRSKLFEGPIPQYAMDAAKAAANGENPVPGATHFFNPYFVHPSWADRMTFVKRMGTTRSTTHDFYKPRGAAPTPTNGPKGNENPANPANPANPSNKGGAP